VNRDPDRPLLVRLVVTLLVPVTIISGAVAFRLGGGVAFLVVIPMGILVGLGLSALLWKTISGASLAFIRTLFSTGGPPPPPPTSHVEALEARGSYHEADLAWANHCTRYPHDTRSHLAWSRLVWRHAGDSARARDIVLTARRGARSPDDQDAVSNALLDLLEATGDRGPWRTELARFAARHPNDSAGHAAREALTRARAELQPDWRYFGTREVQMARAWAANGGIALHENIFRSRGRRTAHLLARDETELVAAAVSVGCDPGWIQQTRTLHFDLVDPMLARALRRCGVDPAAPPRRSSQLPPTGSATAR